MGLFSGITSFVSNAVSTIGDAIGSFFGGGSSSSSSGRSSSGRSSGYSAPLPTYSVSTTNHNTTTTTNHNTTTTTYEPDRVKAAQLENEIVELMRQAQLEIIEAQTKSRIAQEQARAQGFVAISQAITTMQERLNDIAQKRIDIIERGSLRAVKEAEEFYGELDAKIRSDQEKYLREKLPALLEILGKYEAGTPAHEIYRKMVDEDAALQIEHTRRQLEAVVARQDRIVDDILAVKGRITEQTGQLTAVIREALEAKMPELPEMKELPALPV